MQVTIIHKVNGQTQPVTVTIDDCCRFCGEKRGAPRPHRMFSDGKWHNVNIWNNPCGHIDLHQDVYNESRNWEKHDGTSTRFTG